MASTIVAEISRQDLVGLSTPSLALITEVKHLSSYNWIDAPTPTIAVPGSPPLWTAPRAPRRLKKDSGLIYIAQNAARHPDSPLEPLFRALYISNPSFDIRSIDVVTDRNNIRKLLSFINPNSTRNGLETFTINIEIARNTAIFQRAETATQDDSTGHHRIISYRFGDLNFIVRYETDGYVNTGANPSSDSKKPESDSLSTMLGSLSLSTTSNPTTTTPAGSKLTIREEGQVIPRESTLEIKTRVKHKPLEIPEIAPQLWVSQTFKLVRAYHYKGTFERPEVEDVATVIKRWEERNQTDLRKLAVLINKILTVVKAYGGNASVKYDAQKDKLVIWRVGGMNMLPKDLYFKWEDGHSSEAETHTKDEGGADSAAKAVDGEGKNIIPNPGDKKDDRAAEAAEEGEQTSLDNPLQNPKSAKDTESGSQDKGGEHQAADSGEAPPNPLSTS